MFLVVVVFPFLCCGVYGMVESSLSSLSRENEFPHQVAVFFYRRDRAFFTKLGRYRTCGGTLINSKTVLTAAHCILSLGGDRMEIQAGTNDVSSKSNGIISKVRNYTIFGDLKEFVVGGHDVALLHLEDPILENGGSIRYADLDTHEVMVNTTAFLAGWGIAKDSQEKQLMHLRYIKMVVVPIEFCNFKYMMTGNYHLCAGNSTSEACSGDSGGGLVRLLQGPKSKRWSVAGIASFHGTRQMKDDIIFLNDVECGVGYTTFARIGPYIDWILNHTNKPPPAPEYFTPISFSDDKLLQKVNECFGFTEFEEEFVCSGHGNCSFLDTCDCFVVGNRSYIGQDCREYLYFTVDRLGKGTKSERIGIFGESVKIGILGVLVIILIFLSILCKIICK